jgi:hypothetical protein
MKSLFLETIVLYAQSDSINFIGNFFYNIKSENKKKSKRFDYFFSLFFFLFESKKGNSVSRGGAEQLCHEIRFISI